MSSAPERVELSVLALITEHKACEKASAILEENGIPVQFVCRGEGTASNELMDFLGLGRTEKAILLCVIPKNQTPELFGIFYEGLKLKKPGKGIAFTLPVTGVSSFVIKLFGDEMLHHKTVEHSERGENQMNGNLEAGHVFLMAIINQGYSEEVMEAAREAGARGGTVIHARGLAPEEILKKWGISVQPEKEIVLILAERDKKQAIMKAIVENCGSQTKAHGIVISLPVDAVAGLGAQPAPVSGETPDGGED